MAAFLAADGRGCRIQREDARADAVGLRIAVIQSILPEVVVTGLHAEGAGHVVERHTEVELPRRHTNKVGTRREVGKEIAAVRLGDDGGLRRVKQRIGAIDEKFDGDTAHAFSGIRTTIVVRVDEDEVSDGDGAEEAEVHGEVGVSVVHVVDVGVHAELPESIDRFLTGNQHDGGRGDAGRRGIGGVDAVFVEIVVDAVVTTGTRQGVPAGERLARAELGRRDEDDVLALIKAAEEVTPAEGRGRRSRRGARERIGVRSEELHLHAVDPFAIVVEAVAIEIDEHEIADADAVRIGRGEAEVHRQVEIVVVEVIGVRADAGLVLRLSVHGQREDLGADAIEERSDFVDAVVIVGKIVIARGSDAFSAGSRLQTVERAARFELRGRNVQAILARWQRIKEVPAAVDGRAGEDRQAEARCLVAAVELHGDTVHALARIGEAVAVVVDINKVADADRRLEAEVDRQVHGGVDLIVGGVFKARFAAVVSRGVAGEEAEHERGHAVQARIAIVDAVLSHVVITDEAFEDADALVERAAGLERGRGDVNDVVAGAEEIKSIAAGGVAGGEGHGNVHSREKGVGVELDAHAGQALTRVEGAGGVLIREDEVPKRDRAEETDVHSEVDVEVIEVGSGVVTRFDAIVRRRFLTDEIDQSAANAGDPGFIRVEGVLTRVIIPDRKAGQTEQAAQIARSLELDGGEMNEVLALPEVAEQEEPATRRHGRGHRLRHTGGVPPAVELDGRLVTSFTDIEAVVAVFIDEDQVSDAHDAGLDEAEVHRHVSIGIHGVVVEFTAAGALVAGDGISERLRAGRQRDERTVNDGLGSVRLATAVVQIVLIIDDGGDRAGIAASGQGKPFHEVGLGNPHLIDARLLAGEVVVAEGVRVSPADEHLGTITRDPVGITPQFHLHAGDALLARILNTVCVEVIPDEGADGDGVRQRCKWTTDG